MPKIVLNTLFVLSTTILFAPARPFCSLLFIMLPIFSVYASFLITQ